ncbi:uncharacterized protein ATC70_011082 [Mucor velutinosus]|uniref:Integrase catalytic domain-containing protein n=1 Tax=Mucor velutinosus TaxID=708070 RepID=A0AAN7DGC5_9FUNG|nr:hypothetical protein ATC70_011082 [Mucor velutinosus]
MLADDGRVLELNTGRELLHEGTALQKVQEVHKEGHQGILNTLDKVARHYMIQDCRELVTTVVKSCDTCQYRARIRFSKSNPMKVIKTPRSPMNFVSVDAIGPLSTTSKGNKYILTAICGLTRWPMARAVSTIDEVTTGEFYFSEIVSRYGVPARLLSDRGANFISTYVHQFLKQIGCKNIMVTSYRASANGMVEKLNHSLVFVLAKIARDERNIDQWDKYVDSALMVLRSTKNTVTGYSPSYLLYGYEFRTPAVWVSPRLDYVEGEEEELKERIELIGDKLHGVREKAREYSDERKAKAKIRYDANAHFIRQYEVGEQVLLKNPIQDSKFGDKWEGPYKVVQFNKSSGTYHLTGKNSLRLKHAVNGDRLKPYNNEVQRMIPDVMISQASDQF